MVLVGYEWLVVLAIVLVVFLWGLKRLPELARSLGLAKKEFKKAVAKSSRTGKEGKDEAPSIREQERSSRLWLAHSNVEHG